MCQVGLVHPSHEEPMQSLHMTLLGRACIDFSFDSLLSSGYLVLLESEDTEIIRQS